MLNKTFQLLSIHRGSSHLAHVKLQTSHVPLDGFDLLQKDRKSTIIYSCLWEHDYMRLCLRFICFMLYTGYNDAQFASLSLQIIKSDMLWSLMTTSKMFSYMLCVVFMRVSNGLSLQAISSCSLTYFLPLSSHLLHCSSIHSAPQLLSPSFFCL